MGAATPTTPASNGRFLAGTHTSAACQSTGRASAGTSKTARISPLRTSALWSVFHAAAVA
jgi:hypothetical protein